jgi:hypothetical protein
MNFRSAIYMPKDSKSILQATWFEVHAWGEDFVIAQLIGIPEELKPKWNLPFTRAAREVERPKTLPEAAVIVETAAEPAEALAKLLSLELSLQNTHDIMEIGDYRRPKVRHYVELINDKVLPAVPLPPEIFATADNFTQKLIARFIMNDVPQYIMDSARSQMDLYRKLSLATPQQV